MVMAVAMEKNRPRGSQRAVVRQHPGMEFQKYLERNKWRLTS